MHAQRKCGWTDCECWTDLTQSYDTLLEVCNEDDLKHMHFHVSGDEIMALHQKHMDNACNKAEL